MKKEEIRIMDKELKKLLNNYVNVIYGKAFPINPTTHQLHLLLDYIANLEQQCKKQKEVIDNAIGIVEHNRIISEKNRKIRQLKMQVYSDKKELCNRLISNWNKLKKYLRNRYNNGSESINYRNSFLEIIAIMQELEQGSDSDE